MYIYWFSSDSGYRRRRRRRCRQCRMPQHNYYGDISPITRNAMQESRNVLQTVAGLPVTY